MMVQMMMEEVFEENAKQSRTDDYTGMDSKDIIEWWIKQQADYKLTQADQAPSENYVRVKAIADMKPFHIFPLYQAATILPFRTGNELVILSRINEDWIIGYSVEDHRKMVKIIPISYVILKHSLLPRPRRTYSIKNWENFGHPDNIQQEDDYAMAPYRLNVTDPFVR